MKNFKQISLCFILLFIVLLYGCNTPSPTPVIFETDERELNLNVGDIYTPNFKVENLDSYELEYQYESDIIEVVENQIHCLKIGECELYVRIKDQPNINPIKIQIIISVEAPKSLTCEEEIKILIGEQYQLNIEFEPVNASKAVQCVSYDSNIAVGNENGVITGISEGQTYILVKSRFNQQAKQRVLVIVEKPAVEDIVSVDNIELNYNDFFQLEWNVLPLESDQEVVFESNNPAVASIDQNGLITSHKYGIAIVKIQSISNPDIYKNIEVKVSGDKTTDIIVNSETIVLEVGQSETLNIQVLPSTACPIYDVIISDEYGIEINDGILTAKKVGKYKIVIKTIDETDITKEISVEVVGKETPVFVTNEQFEENSNLSWNQEFNPLENIKAYDDKDGDITSNIEVYGNVDNRRYGEYILEYKVKDSDGNETTFLRTITVTWGYDVTVIGHAGSYYGVPNSEEAILYAAEVLKYPAIEIDLKQTKDGIFVLSHDPNWADAILEKTNYQDLMNVEYTVTKTGGVVGGHLSEEERTYTSTICTFERYLEICSQYNIIAVIELKTSPGISNWTEKNAPDQSRMSKIMDLIKKYNMLDRVIFLSSQELCLNWVKTHSYSYIPCQYLTLSSCENETTYNIVKQYNLDISFNVRDGIKISDAWLAKYRALGCKLAVFTFEEYATYEDIQYWIDRGVDYVTTDWHELDQLILPKSK